MSSNETSETDPGPDAGNPADLSPAASQLRIATFRLARRMRTQRAVDSMSDGQFAVLAALKVHGPHTLGELAERERVSAPSMNRTVNCLQDSGYIVRGADERDGRKVVISLTPEGVAVVEETARRRDAWVESSLAELTPAERETLAAAAEIMERMVAR
ncbi:MULTISPECIES: MarR family winged helix-turn-helix transcriptional regulator [Microbacterium]|uniref:Putative HTH-type transcriptional regulator YusO n=1 Tax=Microbacterium trichothecenolyticum TaxID=69370 RepID=A0A0M2HIE1_MICTR|nr:MULTISPECIES: MarR family transcriptional regulator [Microbacterium]KJL44555.1 putative HTH-type transcriptional regulator YusO [Microbacterium trichothecenolyticum]MDR7187507.1 DNA-binding MarR family transcriptional regulator [Microbacterium sp. BE35]